MMVRIFVTEEAFEAIKATLPVGSVALSFTPPRASARFGWSAFGPTSSRRWRGPGESYSDVIIRLASGTLNPPRRELEGLGETPHMDPGIEASHRKVLGGAPLGLKKQENGRQKQLISVKKQSIVFPRNDTPFALGPSGLNLGIAPMLPSLTGLTAGADINKTVLIPLPHYGFDPPRLQFPGKPLRALGSGSYLLRRMDSQEPRTAGLSPEKVCPAYSKSR
jgi:hypothetical protein